ncbi:MAG: BglG family transcription antiterminator [Bacillota bacterium]|nr:BglG family transcription antiterminator [Bacillota bacterium]
MSLDKRSTFILQELIKAEDELLASDLMKKLNVSKRTIYYDLEKVNVWLKENCIPPIMRTFSRGFYLDYETKQRVLSNLRKLRHYQYFFTKNERVSLLGTILIMNNEFVHISDLMERTGVSRVTTFHDLDVLKQEMTVFQLSIEFHKKSGYTVSGSESNKRKAIAHYLTQLFARQGWEQLKNVQSLLNSIVFNNQSLSLDDHVAPLDVTDFYTLLVDYEKSLEVELTDEMLHTLALNLFIIGKRIEQDLFVHIDECEKIVLKATQEFFIAEKLSIILEEKMKLFLLEDEICFLTMLLLGSRVNTISEDQLNNEMDALKNVMKRLIFDFQRYSCIIFQNEEELEKLMFIHLKPAYYRIKYDVFTENPLTETIKENYPEVFQITKKVIFHLEHLVQKCVNDQETAYIAMYFGGWLRRQGATPTTRHRAIIVCGSGIGTSNLLRLQLEQLLATVNIVDSISLRDYQKNQFDADLFFSTVSIKDKGIPVIQVNPILTDEDKRLILTKLNSIEGSEINVKPTLSALLNVIQKHTKIMDEQKLMQDLKSLLQITEIIPKESKKPMLHELLTKKTIQFKTEVRTWEEAIFEASKPLLEQGNITESYIEAMIDNVKNLGPYIVIVPEIAIPHARPEQGVKKLGMSLLCLKNPVSFSKKEEHQVRLVIVLAAIDNELHLQALSQLITLLSDEDKVAKMMSASSPDEIVPILQDLSSLTN